MGSTNYGMGNIDHLSPNYIQITRHVKFEENHKHEMKAEFRRQIGPISYFSKRFMKSQ